MGDRLMRFIDRLNELDCHARGHSWAPWMSAGITGPPDVRYCYRCGEREYRGEPPVVTFTRS